MVQFENLYNGYQPDKHQFSVDILNQDEVKQSQFHKQYVKARKPCIIRGKPLIEYDKSITDHLLQQYPDIADLPVQVEKKKKQCGTFGNTSIKETISFGEFCTRLNDLDYDYYLSTQYDVEKTITAFLIEKKFMPQNHQLMKGLELDLTNIWIGSSIASSRLHHDYHDNLYCLLQGEKQFILFPPSSTQQLNLTLNETVEKVVIQENGLISYEFSRDDLSSDTEDDCEESGFDVEIKQQILLSGKRKRSQTEDDDQDFSDQSKSDAELNFSQEEEEDVDWNGHDDFDDIISNSSQLSQSDEPNNEDQVLDQDPPSFSQIPVSSLHKYISSLTSLKYNLHDKDSQKEETINDVDLSELNPLVCLLQKGDYLYLPAGWFHEVTSSPQYGSHAAINYWYHPQKLE